MSPTPTTAPAVAPPTSPRPVAGPGETPAGSAASRRDPWLDNARFLAATLILVLHFANRVPGDSTAIEWLRYGTWPMRLPVYVLIAGYFSSAAPLHGRRAVALLRNVLFVYLAFELLATFHAWSITGDLKFNPVKPSFALWFLLALFLWRITLPLVAHIRFLLPIAVVASAVGCLIPSLGVAYGASRALAFWPVFLVGWKLKEIGLRRVLDAAWVRPVAATLLLAWLTYSYVALDSLEGRWFKMSSHYSGTMAEELTESLIRLGVLSLAVLGGLSLLALIPRRRLWAVSYLGSGSLYIYLLHPFVLREVKQTDYFASVDSLPEILLLMAGGVGLACVLGSRPVRFCLRWLIQPRYTWPFVGMTATPRSEAREATVDVQEGIAAAISSAGTSATPSPAESRADHGSDQPSAR